MDTKNIQKNDGFLFHVYISGFKYGVIWGIHVRYLGGGFKYFLFSPLLGEDSHFD